VPMFVRPHEKIDGVSGGEWLFLMHEQQRQIH
jgi:hypothetical protein